MSNGQNGALIVHADDFGETDEITAGIAMGITSGVVTSTTVMANMPGTAGALRLAATLADRASFGVHLNFCEGRPLTRALSLTDEGGQFLGKRALALRALLRRLSRREIRAEIHAQVATVADSGVRISHLDGHKHLHQLPQIRDAVAEVARSFGIERVRVTRERGPGNLTSPGRVVREVIARRAARTFKAASLRSAARIVDLKDLMSADPLSRGLARAAVSGGIVEVFCHPGTQLADAEKPGSCRRYDELQYLLAPLWRESLDECGLRLVSWWEV